MLILYDVYKLFGNKKPEKKKLNSKKRKKLNSNQKYNKQSRIELPLDGSLLERPKARNVNGSDQRCQTSVVLQKCLDGNPWCSHGPTILFERTFLTPKKENTIKFYACSAYRDRKDCPSYFTADESNCCKESEDKKFRWKKILCQNGNTEKQPQLFDTISCYCRTCSKLLEKNKTALHIQHDIIKLTNKNVAQPTLNGLLCSKSSSTKEAQYYFSKDCLDTLINQFILKGRADIYVICIGAPRIHEKLLSPETAKDKTRNIRSILLDIDDRLRDFYDASNLTSNSFHHYNMFNHFFFRPSDRQAYLNFLKKANGNILVVTDPPFGGKCELIGRTLEHIKENVNQMSSSGLNKFDVMWIFPYYMERQIQKEIPGIKMSDFQVCYENNDKQRYKDGLEAGKQGCRKVTLQHRYFSYLG